MPNISKTKTPFWAWRPGTARGRTLFEIVRVVEYSSKKGITTNLRVGSVYYGPTRVQKRIQTMPYSTFKKNYRDIEELDIMLKKNLLKSILEKK